VQAKPYLIDGVVQGLVDPRLGDSYDAAQLRQLMFVASLCVRAAAAWRPTMTQVRTETTTLSLSLCSYYTCCPALIGLVGSKPQRTKFVDI
jgi:predicted membrane protein